MVINQFKKLLMSLILFAQVGTMLPMAPAEQPGILSTLASDAVSLIKGAAYCVGAAVKGLGDGYLLARNNPKSALALAVGVPLFGRWIYVNQYKEHIKPIVDRSRANDRIYTKWAMDLWEIQSTVNREQNQVLASFRTDFGAPNHQMVADLAREIAALRIDMQELEDQYLVCKAPLDITLYNIRKEFRAAKDTHALGIGEGKLSFEQSLKIDKEINKTIGAKVMPYLLLSINYGQAARIWCTLKKTQLRLKGLLHLIKPIANGHEVIPVVQRSAVVYDQNFNMTSSHNHT